MDEAGYIEEYYDVIVVGAGSAGIGVSILLEKLKINYTILERDSIGASFQKWPKETKFISPSFTGNSFLMPDLNAVTPDTSPAFDLLTEHPTGADYAHYLRGLAKHFDLEIETGVDVSEVEAQEGAFILKTNSGSYGCRSLIWAAGEFQYPKKDAFEGAELCRHYAEITSCQDVDGDEQVVIGAYESGFDAAVNLTEMGKKVTLLDDFQYMEWVNSDSSYSLSPFTRDRIKPVVDDFDYYPETKVLKVEFKEGKYHVQTDEGETLVCETPPINCTGFDTSLSLVEKHFAFAFDYPLLTKYDESRQTENLFLVGPQVKHDTALFCFIYKYRQRFAIVVEEIARRMHVERSEIEEVLKDYKRKNFYMDDLSCCDDECVC